VNHGGEIGEQRGPGPGGGIGGGAVGGFFPSQPIGLGAGPVRRIDRILSCPRPRILGRRVDRRLGRRLRRSALTAGRDRGKNGNQRLERRGKAHRETPDLGF
jgi:hypothetical protein